MEKNDLLQNVETIKQEIEKGNITDLLIIGCDQEGSVTTKISSNGVEALGLVEILKKKVNKEINNQSRKSDFREMLNMFVGDH